MSEQIASMLEEARAFEDSPQGVGLKLRIALSSIVLQKLDELGWTESKLLQETSFSESYISRFLHSNANWTTEDAGRLLFAVGIKDLVITLGHQRTVR